LIGETGVGKSTFIELLSNGKITNISSNKFDSCTKQSCSYKIDDLSLIDTPGLNDSDGDDQKHLDELFDFCIENQPFRGVILFVEKSDRIRDSVKQLFMYYRIFLKITKEMKIVLCITKTNDDVFKQKVLNELNKIGYCCEITSYCWVLNKNNEILQDIVDDIFSSNILFNGFQSVQTMKNKIELLNKEKLSYEKNIKEITNKMKLLENNNENEILKLKEEMNKQIKILTIQKEKILNEYLDCKNKYLNGVNYEEDTRCNSTKTITGKPCRNSRNCYYRKIGKHF
jgi:GTP-binding protein EngB required for normal cell division